MIKSGPLKHNLWGRIGEKSWIKTHCNLDAGHGEGKLDSIFLQLR